jgi:DNA polymerase (family X)
MENIEIANRLEELADLLEIRGANPFRIRAYRNAVRTVRGLTRPLAEMVAAEEDLTVLPGIGKDLSQHIRELLETGGLALLDEVSESVPRELALLTRLEGVGPKKAKKLWEELQVVGMDDLEAAIAEGRVQELEGFGARSAEKILRSIEAFRKRQGRFLRADAAKILRPLLVHLKAAPGVERVEIAGSFRRGRETVGDIDLLALCGEDAGAVMDHFTSFASVERVEMSGETRGSVVLRAGLPVDLRILPAEAYGAALHYFTGSKEHNVAIRKRARERGLRVSEYGVFEAADGEEGPEAGKRIGGATEEEVFEAVGLPWIPPELREDRGEIEAADAGALPELVGLEDVRGDLHMHTTWSDGKNSVREMAEACRERGYAYMAVTAHSPAVTVARGLGPERLREQWDEIDRARDEVEGIEILRGCEVDIRKDGSLDLPDEILEGLDVVLVAVHSHMALDQATMTKRVVRALAHPLVDILVHPTGRLINRRDPYAIDVEALLDAAKEHDVAVELNLNPYRLDLHDRHLFRARELGVTVSLGTDAHRVAHLDHMAEGLLQARRGWLEPRHVVNCRAPKDLHAWLERKAS